MDAAVDIITAPLLYPDICTVVGIRAEMRSPCTVLQPLHFQWLNGTGNKRAINMLNLGVATLRGISDFAIVASQNGYNTYKLTQCY
jgi:hypothetical protein